MSARKTYKKTESDAHPDLALGPGARLATHSASAARNAAAGISGMPITISARPQQPHQWIAARAC